MINVPLLSWNNVVLQRKSSKPYRIVYLSYAYSQRVLYDKANISKCDTMYFAACHSRQMAWCTLPEYSGAIYST
jgi:hypothetical protein